jgi:hypothetical protein
VLIAIILFFTTHNTTLGLLVALCLIVASNQFFGVNKIRIEGYKNKNKNINKNININKNKYKNKNKNINKNKYKNIEGNTNMDKLTDDENENDDDDENDENEDIPSPSINPDLMKPIDSASIPVSKEAFRSIDVAPSENISSQHSIIV